MVIGFPSWSPARVSRLSRRLASQTVSVGCEGPQLHQKKQRGASFCCLFFFTSMTMRPMGLPSDVMSKKHLGLLIFADWREKERARETSTDRCRGYADGHKQPRKMGRCGLTLYNASVGGRQQPIRGARGANFYPVRPINGEHGRDAAHSPPHPLPLHCPSPLPPQYGATPHYSSYHPSFEWSLFNFRGRGRTEHAHFIYQCRCNLWMRVPR